MNGYKYARTTALSRALIIKRKQTGWTGDAIAESLGISRRTVCKWLARWRQEGEAGLHDRTSRPKRSPRKLAAACEKAVVHLRRTFLMPAYGIAANLKLAYSTVCRYLVRHGISRKRDNGVGYKKRYRNRLSAWGIKHITTRPYTPKTNGKAERFIRTSLEEWAYAQPYAHSRDRTEALPLFLDFYNNHRQHHGINMQTPISRCEQRHEM